MRSKDLVEADAKYIFTDFKMMASIAIHVPNFVVAQTACTECLERSVDAKCIECGMLCCWNGCDRCGF